MAVFKNIVVHNLYEIIRAAGLPLFDNLPTTEEIAFWLTDNFLIRFIEHCDSGKYPKFKLLKSHAIMTILNKQGKEVEILVDKEDIPRLMNQEWVFLNYTFSTSVGLLHRYLMSDKLIDDKKHLVDHINGNVYDNRKCNLRLATRSQNSANCKKRSNNTSGITGVVYDKATKQWKASISYKKKTKLIGRFNSKAEAIYARLEKERELFGAFAPQRHMFEEYGLGAVTAQVEEIKFNSLETVIKIFKNFLKNKNKLIKLIFISFDTDADISIGQLVSLSKDGKQKNMIVSYFDLLSIYTKKAVKSYKQFVDSLPLINILR